MTMFSRRILSVSWQRRTFPYVYSLSGWIQWSPARVYYSTSTCHGPL